MNDFIGKLSSIPIYDLRNKQVNNYIFKGKKDCVIILTHFQNAILNVDWSEIKARNIFVFTLEKYINLKEFFENYDIKTKEVLKND